MDLIQQLDSWDKALLLFLNDIHSPLWDQVMIFVTERYTWIPFYIVIIASIIFKEKKGSIAVIIAIILMAVTADLFASSFLKPTVGRLRPCHDAAIYAQLRFPNKCGGQFGFVSSHAANTFALATILFLLYHKKHKWVIILFIWAAFVSYSRIYLGVHYPGDIIAGALSGIFWGFIYFGLLNKTKVMFPKITGG